MEDARWRIEHFTDFILDSGYTPHWVPSKSDYACYSLEDAYRIACEFRTECRRVGITLKMRLADYEKNEFLDVETLELICVT